MNEPKPGNLTTEYRMTVAMAFATVLISFGVISEADKEMVVTAVLALLPLAAVIWKYIEGRTRVKEAAAKGATITLPAVTDGTTSTQATITTTSAPAEADSGGPV